MDYGVIGFAMFLNVICWLWSYKKWEWRGFDMSKAYITMILFGFLHVLSLIWTVNMDASLKTVSMKLSFILYPIMFSLMPKIKKEEFLFAVVAFIFAIIGVDIFVLIKSGFSYLNNFDSSIFFYHDLSGQVGLNAIYFSVINGVALLFLLFDVSPNHRYLKVIGVLFFSTMLILLFSKMVIGALLILLIIYALIYGSEFIRKLKWNSPALILIVAIVLSFLWLGINSEIISGRVNEFRNSEVKTAWVENDLRKLRVEGISIRVFQYRALKEIIRDQPGKLVLGYGHNAHQNLLNDKYIKYHVYTGKNNDAGVMDLSFHNQFVFTFLSLGFIGLGVLIWLFVVWLKQSYLSHDLSMFFVALLFMFVFLTEMFLERQRGVMFFVVVLTVLIKRNANLYSRN